MVVFVATLLFKVLEYVIFDFIANVPFTLIMLH